MYDVFVEYLWDYLPDEAPILCNLEGIKDLSEDDMSLICKLMEDLEKDPRLNIKDFLPNTALGELWKECKKYRVYGIDEFFRQFVLPNIPKVELWNDWGCMEPEEYAIETIKAEFSNVIIPDDGSYVIEKRY